jgi:hypothetical protein
MTDDWSPSIKILKELHNYSANHRKSIEASNMCGCFYCLTMFKPPEITEWVDRYIPRSGPAKYDFSEGQTALCPKCGIDAVLPDNTGYMVLYPEITLKAMSEYWFDSCPT